MTLSQHSPFVQQPDRSNLDDDAFRALWSGWIRDNCTGDMLRPAHRLGGTDLKDWLRFLHREGWRAPGWPREYGGMGLSLAQQIIYRDELERQGVTRWQDLGESLLGPVLFAYASDAQKAHYLPRILDCTDFWCQGYSEPNAGSDLASLSTSAVRDGGDFIVNGQKIWTTYAHFASHIFALVRTEKRDRRQDGISFLLIDMASAGITVRTIEKITGEAEFCEVFFDDVRVPAANLVGEINKGWMMAKSLLEHERAFIGSPNFAGQALEIVKDLGGMLGLTSDAGFRSRLDQLTADLFAAKALYADICDRMIGGEQLNMEFSVMKLVTTELLQRICDTGAEHLLPFAGGGNGPAIRGALEDIEYLYLIARPVTIFGGTSEVQRDIVARGLLPGVRAASANR